MKNSLQRWLWATLAAFTLAGTVGAQPFPNKPVKIIVTFPPGGTPDIYGRVLAQ